MDLSSGLLGAWLLDSRLQMARSLVPAGMGAAGMAPAVLLLGVSSLVNADVLIVM